MATKLQEFVKFIKDDVNDLAQQRQALASTVDRISEEVGAKSTQTTELSHTIAAQNQEIRHVRQIAVVVCI